MRSLERIINNTKNLVGAILLAGALTFNFNGCSKEKTTAPPPPQEEKLEQLIGVPGKIIFTRYSLSDKNYKLWIIKPDTTGLRRIYDNLRHFSASPNGKYIAFTDPNCDHTIIDLEGVVQHEFEGGQEWFGYEWAWTPDSKSILFGSYFDGIYKYNLDDKTKTKLVNSESSTYDHNPIMSPDLSKIVYVHNEYAYLYYVHLINSDGSNNKVIASGDNASKDAPLGFQWVDNEHIFFKTDHPVFLETGGYYPLTNLHFLDIISGEEKIFDTKSYIEYLQISPLGTTITLFKADGLIRINTSELYSETLDLTPDYNLAVDNEAWSPDEQYFILNRRYGPKSVGLYSRDGKEYMLLEGNINIPQDDCSVDDIEWVPD